MMRTKLSVVRKAVSTVKHEGGHGGKRISNFYQLRCDIQSCKRWYLDVCVDVL